MIGYTMGIFHQGLRYEGRLISCGEPDSNGIYECKYQWLYGIHTVYIS